MGPGQPRVCHDLQPPNKSLTWQLRHPQRHAEVVSRWFEVHIGPEGALSQTGNGTKSFPALPHSSPSSFADSELSSLIQASLLPNEPQSFSPTTAFLQTPFLWNWPLLIIGLVKAIIINAWMVDAFATFQGVFVNSDTALRSKMDSGGGLLWSGESSGFLEYSRKLLTPKLICQPQKCHASPFIGNFASTSHQTELNMWRKECWPACPIRSHESFHQHYFSSNVKEFSYDIYLKINVYLDTSHSPNLKWVKSWITKNVTPSSLGI